MRAPSFDERRLICRLILRHLWPAFANAPPTHDTLQQIGAVVAWWIESVVGLDHEIDWPPLVVAHTAVSYHVVVFFEQDRDARAVRLIDEITVGFPR